MLVVQKQKDHDMQSNRIYRIVAYLLCALLFLVVWVVGFLVSYWVALTWNTKDPILSAIFLTAVAGIIATGCVRYDYDGTALQRIHGWCLRLLGK